MDGPSITLPSALVQADSRLCGPPSDAPVWRAARAHAAWAARQFPPFELGCCDATADTTVHLLPCLTSFQGGADKKGSPKRCEMVAAGTAAG